MSAEKVSIKETAEAVKGVIEAVPVYDDLLKPSVQEVGKGLHTLSKTIHIALAPVSALVWGYDKICSFITDALEKRLKSIPHDRIITPDPTVAGPTLEALRFSGHKEDLRELYANLLSTAMDKQTAMNAHPAFVEILKQITSDEAKIISLLINDKSLPILKIKALDELNHYSEPLINFSLLPEQANCLVPELGPTYLENIARFGLATISYTSYSTIHTYDKLDNHLVTLSTMQRITTAGKRPEIVHGTFCRTNLGGTFYKACIKSY